MKILYMYIEPVNIYDNNYKFHFPKKEEQARNERHTNKEKIDRERETIMHII